MDVSALVSKICRDISELETNGKPSEGPLWHMNKYLETRYHETDYGFLASLVYEGKFKDAIMELEQLRMSDSESDKKTEEFFRNLYDEYLKDAENNVEDSYRVAREKLEKAWEGFITLNGTKRPADAVSDDKEISEKDIRDALKDLCGEASPEGLRTGFVQLDDMLGGIRAGDLIVVGGRPSMGKTAFALNLVNNMAIQGNTPVLYLSLQLSKHQLLRRLLCLISDVFISCDQRPEEDDIRKLEKAGEDLVKSHLMIDDTLCFSIEDLENRLVASKEMPKLLIVDDLDLLMSFCPDVQKPDMLLELKALGKKYGFSILGTAQLSRKPETRKDHRPYIWDFRDAKAILRAGDAALLLYREYYYDFDADDSVAELSVVGGRRKGGVVKMLFSRDSLRFSEIILTGI